MLACRSHSDRQKSRGGGEERGGPAETARPQLRRGQRKRFDVAGPVGVHPLRLPRYLPQRCATPTPPFLPSRRLSADCLALSLLIRPIALCRRHAQHLSYHCLDNSLLVQKSLRARRSHDDDTVTLPGGSEPPAEIARPLSSTSVSFFARPSASFLPFLLLAAAPSDPYFWGASPPPQSGF